MENSQNIFELAEVAEILHLPASRIKNWTIGRPLTITPSVRPASGTGSRNLYNANDVYLFALAEDLNEFGIVPRLTQQVLDRVRGKLAADLALLIGGTADAPHIEFYALEGCVSLLGHMGSPCGLCKKKTAADFSYETVRRLAKWKEGAYLRDLSALVTRVDKVIEKRVRRGA